MAKHRATGKNREIVEQLAAFGIKPFIISQIMGIDIVTLKEHYMTELLTARSKATAQIANKVYAQAMQGCVRSQRLWLLSRGGWSENSTVNHTMDEVPPVEKEEENTIYDLQEAQRVYKQLCKEVGTPRTS